MIVQPVTAEQHVSALARKFHNAPSTIAELTKRARNEVIEKAAHAGHNITRPTVHVTREVDDETQDLRIVAVIAGANGMDGQLFGGELDGLRVALDMPNGWLPVESITKPVPGGRTIEYNRAGIESTTGQWVYTLQRNPAQTPQQ